MAFWLHQTIVQLPRPLSLRYASLSELPDYSSHYSPSLPLGQHSIALIRGFQISSLSPHSRYPSMFVVLLTTELHPRAVLTRLFPVRTTITLRQAIVISFDILPSLALNSRKFNSDWKLSLTRPLLILFIPSPSQFTHNDLNAHTFHSSFIIHNSLYFLHLKNSLIHSHTYSILRSNSLNYIQEPSHRLWLHNIQFHSPIVLTHVSSSLSTFLLVRLTNSYSHPCSLNYYHNPVVTQLHSYWTYLHSQTIVAQYTRTFSSHDII